MEKRFRPKTRSAPRSSPTSSASRPVAREAAPVAASCHWEDWAWVRLATALSSAPAKRFKICRAARGGSEGREEVMFFKVDRKSNTAELQAPDHVVFPLLLEK